MEEKQRRYRLSEQDCFCSLPDFYRNVISKMGLTETDDTMYDCRKICITKEAQEKLMSYYTEVEEYTKFDISALILCYGPKANLEDENKFACAVEEGFVEFN